MRKTATITALSAVALLVSSVAVAALTPAGTNPPADDAAAAAFDAERGNSAAPDHAAVDLAELPPVNQPDEPGPDLPPADTDDEPVTPAEEHAAIAEAVHAALAGELTPAAGRDFGQQVAENAQEGDLGQQVSEAASDRSHPHSDGTADAAATNDGATNADDNGTPESAGNGEDAPGDNPADAGPPEELPAPAENRGQNRP